MANKRRSGVFLVILVVMLLAAMACEINVGGPAMPQTPIAISTEAVESLTLDWEAAVEGALEDGRVTVEITETQITSYLAFKLEEQEDPLFSDPQVYLQDGQLQIYGTVQQGYLVGTMRVLLSVAIDDEGIPYFELTAVDFGPWDAPEGLLNGLSTLLDEAFTGAVGPVATGIRIESITISDGVMSITGRIR